jgi:hypothetical protein
VVLLIYLNAAPQSAAFAEKSSVMPSLNVIQFNGPATIWDAVSRNTVKEANACGPATSQSSGIGHSRRFNRPPITSGFPRLANFLSDRRHVSKVPIAEVIRSRGVEKTKIVGR